MKHGLKSGEALSRDLEVILHLIGHAWVGDGGLYRSGMPNLACTVLDGSSTMDILRRKDITNT